MSAALCSQRGDSKMSGACHASAELSEVGKPPPLTTALATAGSASGIIDDEGVGVHFPLSRSHSICRPSAPRGARPRGFGYGPAASARRRAFSSFVSAMTPLSRSTLARTENGVGRNPFSEKRATGGATFWFSRAVLIDCVNEVSAPRYAFPWETQGSGAL